MLTISILGVCSLFNTLAFAIFPCSDMRHLCYMQDDPGTGSDAS